MNDTVCKTVKDRFESDARLHHEVTMNCFFCNGPYHPATGSFYTERVRACGPCARSFFGWVKGHVARWSSSKRPNFYEAAFKFRAPAAGQRRAF